MTSRNLILTILFALVKANIKLRFIKRIIISDSYELFTGNAKPLVIIECLKHSYVYTDLLENVVKNVQPDIKFEIIYLGEFDGVKDLPKNMWVKMTQEERDAHKKLKDPCTGCPYIKLDCANSIKSDVLDADSLSLLQINDSECQLLNDYVNGKNLHSQ